MSETGRPNWAEMTREDFEVPPEPKPGPPGQIELFEPGPGTAKHRAKPQRAAGCPVGTQDLLGLLEAEGHPERPC